MRLAAKRFINLVPNYAGKPRFVFKVSDNSMNAAQPVPLVPHMVVFCVDLTATPSPFESGQLYVFRIREPLGEKHQMMLYQDQTIIRRLKISDAKHYELVAESKYPWYKNLICTGQPSTNVTENISAIGRVRGIAYDLDVTKSF